MLQSNSMIISNFESDKNTIQENLTMYKKKRLFNHTKLAKQYLNFLFVWTFQGRIRLRKGSGSRTINVSSLHDLAKRGYSGPARLVSVILCLCNFVSVVNGCIFFFFNYFNLK